MMKIQDIVFLVLFAFLAYKQNPKLSAASGIIALIVAIPLFTFWVFFTGERLVWYGAAFFLLCIVQNLIGRSKI